MQQQIVPVTNSAVNAQVDAELPAGPTQRRWRIVLLFASVSAGSALFQLIEDKEGVAEGLHQGPKTIFQQIITPTSPLQLAMGAALQQTISNASVTARLAAAGVGNTGTVNIAGYLL